MPDDDDDKALMKLLYRAAEVHAFAKMRLHTEDTLVHLARVTKEFGKRVRRFNADMGDKYTIVELRSEVDRRGRAHLAQVRRQAPGAPPPGPPPTNRRRPKALNLFTYKWHSLPDYPPAIRLFGGTDSISTQLVSSNNQIIFLLIMFHRGNLPIALSRCCTA
jgi:hypothetical protein